MTHRGARLLATVLGGVAVGSRVLFPVLWSMGVGGHWNLRVELSTQPFYMCVMGMFGAVATWAVTGINIVKDFSTYWMISSLFIWYGLYFLFAFVVGELLHRVTRGAYDNGATGLW